MLGQAAVDAPPAVPQFPALAPANLVITNTGGVVALKLTCPADPGENTIVRGSKPLSSGRPRGARRARPRHLPGARARRVRHHRPLHGGIRRAARRQAGVRAVQPDVDGYQSLPMTFSAVVPATV